ncbi:hypothetical protein BK026_08735 [Alteromonas sp. V450]|uniref:class I SAM-dependent methyltransferase n=1 Tax=Alteromonas sp. V450 TaxID=1912139 RepID=UPI0008FF0C98|nr:class I SAM-dependent methyltransferase [Alteromonas sp. V450]OJF68872.1 hypothetical protein BK026_08735 [Alteromonas sp. V450]
MTTHYPDDLPVIETTKVKQCPVCDCESFHSFAKGQDYELETCANIWEFVQCAQCTHVWLNPRPSVATLNTIYPPHYYSYDFETKVHPIALKAKAILDKLKFKSFFKHLKQTPKTYADVGCGSGRFLKLMHHMGLKKQDIYGLELTQSVVDELNNLGFNGINSRVEEVKEIEPESLDLVTMFHVIEHVEDPRAVVAKINQWLSKDGCLVLETPNFDSVDAKLFKNQFWGGYHIPRHWHVFSVDTLVKLLEDNGFDIVAIKYQPGHSFWLYSFHHLFKYKLNMPRVAKWFDPIGSLLFLVLFTGLDKLRAPFMKTSSVLAVARKKA